MYHFSGEQLLESLLNWLNNLRVVLVPYSIGTHRPIFIFSPIVNVRKYWLPVRLNKQKLLPLLHLIVGST